MGILNKKKSVILLIIGLIAILGLGILIYLIITTSVRGLGVANSDNNRNYGQIIHDSDHTLIANFQSGDIFEFNSKTNNVNKLLNTGGKIASADLNDSSNIVTISPLEDGKLIYKQFSLSGNLINTSELDLSELEKITLEPNSSIQIVKSNIFVNKSIVFPLNEYDSKLGEFMSAVAKDDTSIMENFLFEGTPIKSGFCSSSEYKDFKFTYTISKCLIKDKFAIIPFTLTNSIESEWNPWGVKLLDIQNNLGIVIQDRYSKDNKDHQQKLFLANDRDQKELTIESDSEIVDAAFTSDGNVLTLVRKDNYLDWKVINK